MRLRTLLASLLLALPLHAADVPIHDVQGAGAESPLKGPDHSMVATPDPRERKGEEVSTMFGAITPTYDLLNHGLSLTADRYWRTEAGRRVTASAWI